MYGLMDTRRMTSEESTTPDLAERSRNAIEAAGRRDFDSAVSFYAPDAVWDVSAMGMGRYEGVAVMRRELEQWINAYQQFEIEVEEVRDLGNGVILSVTHQGGHPLGSSGYLQMRFASVTVWRDGLIARVTPYPDIDEARAAAERLAQERG
jgi:ketosteroid isomerase-like protein